jgi:hypothetical protein
MLTDDRLQIDIYSETPGDSWRWAIPVEGFTPVAGDTARAHVRVKADAPAVTLAFSTAAGTIELNAGEIVLKAPASATAAVAPGNYVWDLELTRAGEVDTIFTRCTLSVSRDVTR